MEEKISKRGYYLPDTLTEFFSEWCSPGRDFSPKAAAGLLLYMAVDTEIQQEAEKLAHSKNIKSAIVTIRKSIDRATVKRKKLEYLESLPDEQKQKILFAIAKLEE